MYKLIAIDIDDTLLNDDIKITDRVFGAIKAAQDKGVIVVLCTGRTLKGGERFYEQLKLDTLFITSGGAEIYDSNRSRVYEDEVDPVLVKQVLQYAYDNDIHAQVYIDGELVYKERNKYSALYEIPYGHPGILIPDLMEHDEILTPKVLYVLDAHRASAVKEDVQRKFATLAIKTSKPMFIEFASVGVSKAVGLQFVADYYNIEIKDVIAIGDSQIDAPMIELAGLGVVMQNAPEALKDIADIICPSNENDGVAYVIEKYILEA
ncbi:MAG: HAD family phosphatase [Clostridia bacterium]|jgi:Cof subfamily protein (haloacid dehalogenase superfamily)|nr:HAD family phosphatase [Clostridia bacterium]MBT7121970.1 HAD family phosphatase [Clostridia bacterium]